MKISKSKQELAKIVAENGGWKDQKAEWSAQDGSDGQVSFFKIKAPTYSKPEKEWMAFGDSVHCYGSRIECCKVIKNFHQTILSRAEYFHLYPAPDADGWIEHDGKHKPEISTSGLTIWCKWSDGLEQSHEANMVDWIDDSDVRVVAYRLHKPEQAKPEFCKSVMRAIPEPEAKPTIEQLAADYRNAKDYADRKQQEADDAKADADEKLRVLELAGEAHGLLVTPITEKQETELAAAVKVGDEVECVKSNIKRDKYNGMVGRLHTIDESDTSTPYLVDFGGNANIWCHEVKFIRRT